MKKISQIIFVLLAAVMLAGCAGGNGVAEQGDSVQIAKDGSVTGTLVDVLDQSYYNSEELKTMIETEIAEAIPPWEPRQSHWMIMNVILPEM